MENGELEAKCNNDILIPRSILKKNEVPQYKENAELQDDYEELEAYGSGADDVAPNEAVIGR
jgi:hypothetical protein